MLMRLPGKNPSLVFWNTLTVCHVGLDHFFLPNSYFQSERVEYVWSRGRWPAREHDSSPAIWGRKPKPGTTNRSENKI